MVKEINELKKIIYLIYECYECLIDEELEPFQNDLRKKLYKDKLKGLIEKENIFITEILNKYGSDAITDYINGLKESASKFDNVILKRILNKINFISSPDACEDKLKSVIEKEIYFLSLRILMDIIKDHPELKEKLILSIYYSYFDIENSDIEAEILANDFKIEEHPTISSDLFLSIYMPTDIHNIFKDNFLFELFKEKIKLLVILSIYTDDYDLIYYNMSFIRAIIIEASNKESFINDLKNILEDEAYSESHIYIKEILNKLDADKCIPIYISNRPKRG